MLQAKDEMHPARGVAHRRHKAHAQKGARACGRQMRPRLQQASLRCRQPRMQDCARGSCTQSACLCRLRLRACNSTRGTAHPHTQASNATNTAPFLFRKAADASSSASHHPTHQQNQMQQPNTPPFLSKRAPHTHRGPYNPYHRPRSRLAPHSLTTGFYHACLQDAGHAGVGALCAEEPWVQEGSSSRQQTARGAASYVECGSMGALPWAPCMRCSSRQASGGRSLSAPCMHAKVWACMMDARYSRRAWCDHTSALIMIKLTDGIGPSSTCTTQGQGGQSANTNLRIHCAIPKTQASASHSTKSYSH